MNIDRNNYEEYFILYLDDELSTEDKRLVEQFVEQHADLREEFELLVSSKLPVDESIIFSDKQSLLRTETSGVVNSANFEEYCLLYTDNELSAAERKQVEDVAAGTPALLAELQRFAKTVATPEHIVFTDKSSLYRKEEKQRPVVFFTIRRIAIAASFILAVSTTALILSKNRVLPAGGDTVAVNTDTGRTQEKIKLPVTGTTSTLGQEDVAPTDIDVADAPTSDVKAKSGETSKANEQTTDVVSRSTNPNNLAQPLHNPYVNGTGEANDTKVARVETPAAASLTNPKEIYQLPAVTVDNARPLQSGYVTASNSIEPEAVMYTEVSEPGRKNKLRGFFRKVTRTFEKATNIQATDDEDRLLVGSLSIKL